MPTNIPVGFNLQEYVSMRCEAIEQIIDERDRLYNTRFDADAKAVFAALAAQDKYNLAAAASSREAILKAETATEKRFDSVNEFRSTLSDQTRSFVSRDLHDKLESEFDRRFSEMIERVANTEKSISKREGGDVRGATDQSRQQWVIMLVIGIVSFVLSMSVTFILRGLP
jgi:hypothetical protein